MMDTKKVQDLLNEITKLKSDLKDILSIEKKDEFSKDDMGRLLEILEYYQEDINEEQKNTIN
jgi:hypothetical protein